MSAQGAALQNHNSELVKCERCVEGMRKRWRRARSNAAAMEGMHMHARPCTCTCAWGGTGIEDLREKRDEILKQLREDDAEKAKITQELQILTKRLAQVNESIARKVRLRRLRAFESGAATSGTRACRGHAGRPRAHANGAHACMRECAACMCDPGSWHGRPAPLASKGAHACMPRCLGVLPTVAQAVRWTNIAHLHAWG